MKFHEFCNDPLVQEYFRRLQARDAEAKRLLAERMGMMVVEYHEIAPVFRRRNVPLSRHDWEQIREDVQQELILFRLLDNKLRTYRPTKGHLMIYLSSVIVSIAVDMHKKRHYMGKGKNKTRIENLTAALQEELTSKTSKAEKVNMTSGQVYPTLKLKLQCYHEIQMQTCLRRVILKLWRPYFFAYSFEPDEQNLLQSKQLDLAKLKQELQDRIVHNVERQSDIHIAPQLIAQWLKMSSDAVNQHLTNLRKKFNWLRKENLRDALAET